MHRVRSSHHAIYDVFSPVVDRHIGASGHCHESLRLSTYRCEDLSRTQQTRKLHGLVTHRVRVPCDKNPPTFNALIGQHDV